MLIILPFQAIVTRYIAKLRRVMLKWTGERIKIINEMLQVIFYIMLFNGIRGYVSSSSTLGKKAF